MEKKRKPNKKGRIRKHADIPPLTDEAVIDGLSDEQLATLQPRHFESLSPELLERLRARVEEYYQRVLSGQ